jgi:hypothetical protein
MARLVRDDWFVNGSFFFGDCVNRNLDQLKVSREDEGTSSAVCEVEGVAGGHVVNRVSTYDLVLECACRGVSFTLRRYEGNILAAVLFAGLDRLRRRRGCFTWTHD